MKEDKRLFFLDQLRADGFKQNFICKKHPPLLLNSSWWFGWNERISIKIWTIQETLGVHNIFAWNSIHDFLLFAALTQGISLSVSIDIIFCKRPLQIWVCNYCTNYSSLLFWLYFSLSGQLSYRDIAMEQIQQFRWEWGLCSFLLWWKSNLIVCNLDETIVLFNLPLSETSYFW